MDERAELVDSIVQRIVTARWSLEEGEVGAADAALARRWPRPAGC
jgi:hypothetical protein